MTLLKSGALRGGVGMTSIGNLDIKDNGSVVTGARGIRWNRIVFEFKIKLTLLGNGRGRECLAKMRSIMRVIWLANGAVCDHYHWHRFL